MDFEVVLQKCVDLFDHLCVELDMHRLIIRALMLDVSLQTLDKSRIPALGNYLNLSAQGGTQLAKRQL